MEPGPSVVVKHCSGASVAFRECPAAASFFSSGGALGEAASGSWTPRHPSEFFSATFDYPRSSGGGQVVTVTSGVEPPWAPALYATFATVLDAAGVPFRLHRAVALTGAPQGRAAPSATLAAGGTLYTLADLDFRPLNRAKTAAARDVQWKVALNVFCCDIAGAPPPAILGFSFRQNSLPDCSLLEFAGTVYLLDRLCDTSAVLLPLDALARAPGLPPRELSALNACSVRDGFSFLCATVDGGAGGVGGVVVAAGVIVGVVVGGREATLLVADREDHIVRLRAAKVSAKGAPTDLDEDDMGFVKFFHGKSRKLAEVARSAFTPSSVTQMLVDDASGCVFVADHRHLRLLAPDLSLVWKGLLPDASLRRVGEEGGADVPPGTYLEDQHGRHYAVEVRQP